MIDQLQLLGLAYRRGVRVICGWKMLTRMTRRSAPHILNTPHTKQGGNTRHACGVSDGVIVDSPESMRVAVRWVRMQTILCVVTQLDRSMDRYTCRHAIA